MVFLDHVQNLHIHAEKTHKDFGAHRVQALFMYGVDTYEPAHPAE